MKQPFNLSKEQLLSNLTDLFEKPVNLLAVGVDGRNYLVSTTVETPIKDMVYSDKVKRIFIDVMDTEDEERITSEDLVVVINPKQRSKVGLEGQVFNSLSVSANGTLEGLRDNIAINNDFVSEAHNYLKETLNLETSVFKYNVSKHVPLEGGQYYYGLTVSNLDYRRNINLVITYHMMALALKDRLVAIHDHSHDVEAEDLSRLLKEWFGIGERDFNALFGE